MDKPRYAYSYDREDYTGSFASPEEAVGAAVSNAEFLANPPTEIYVGTIVNVDPQATDHAEAIVENMNRRAHVDYGDVAARYLKHVSKDKIKELDDAIAQTILSWLERHKLMPTFVKVSDIREYPVPYPSFSCKGGDSSGEVHDLGVSELPADNL